MPHLRPLVRTLLGLLIVASCMAAAIVPMLGRVAAAPSYVPSAAPGDIVIAAFRFSGPNGPGDEYIELFNRSCNTTPIDLQGWTVYFSDGSGAFPLLYTFPSGATIASGGYFLLAGPAYSGTAPRDASYTTGIPFDTGGVAIFSNTTTPVDQAGFNTNGYYEANVLAALPSNSNQSYVRKLSSTGMYLDSNNNAA
ncbi:MAG TPA: lamin tail domain-containing protein, partial [Anaerolineales bacterium]